MRKDVGDSHGPELISGRTLLFVVNVAWFFLSHRLALARAAMAAGLRVHLAASVEDQAEILQVREAGVEFHRLDLARGGTNPLRDLGTFRRLQRIMSEVRPELVHNVTAKPIVYGTQAARASGVRGIVNAVSGFGYAYASRSRRLLRGLLDTGFERAFRPANVRIVVQNADDRAAVLRLCPAAGQRIRLILGSGVDLREFRPSCEPRGVPTVLLPARVLREKGVHEFAAAAAELRRAGVVARFVLAGRLDPANRGALTGPEVQALCTSSGMEWLGDCKNMPQLIADANVVCLPSYREGAPKALLEACAAARAVITSDTAGCRDVVDDGLNGLLVPPRDSIALAAAIRRLVESPELRQRMGLAGRVRAENEFGVERVVQSHLEIYRDLLAAPAG